MGSAYDIFVDVSGDVELLARVWDALDVQVGSRCQLHFEQSAISLWEAPEQTSGATSRPTLT
jgi:hypothetical protein